jgi:curved DNA-binding protein
MEYKDYYKTLGVSKSATEKEIKQAFRKLARQCHPDACPDDPKAEARFKEINEAYEVLSDAKKRKKYDTLGSDWARWQQTGGQPGDFDWGRYASGAPGGPGGNVRYATAEDLQDLFGGGSTFSDFFSQIFGGMAGGRARGGQGSGSRIRSQRGQDYEQEVEITLEDAFHGATRILQSDGERLEVKIPQGADTGTRVRLSGKGSPGVGGGPAGDIYLKVKVRPHARFERKGDDLNVTFPVDLYTAVLGGEVRIPTLEGDVLLRIPAGTQNGRVFRLRGKGMPSLRQPDHRGDLLAKVDVQLPAALTPEQRKLFEELKRIS